MKRKPMQGLSLQPVPERKRTFFAALLDSLLLLGGVLLLLDATCGFLSAGTLWMTLGVGLLALVLEQLSLRLEKLRLVGLLLPTGCLLIALLSGSALCSGWQKIYAAACDILTRARGTLYLPRLSGTGETGGAALFCCLTAALLAMLCCRLTRCSRTLCGAGLCLLTVGTVLLLKPQSGESWMALCLLFSLLLLPKNAPGKGDGSLLAETATLLAFALLLTLLSGVLSGEDNALFSRLTEQSEAALHQLRYETQGQVLPEGDLSRSFTPANTGETLLRVTMEQPESVYLRGFTGDVLENDRWSGFSRQTLADNSDLLYWLHRQAFYPQSQLWSAVQSMEDTPETQTITIENPGACSAWLYLPCGVVQGEDYTPLLSMLEPSSYPAEGWNGVRQYRLQMLTHAAECARDVVEYYSAAPEQGQRYLSGESAYRAFLQQQLTLPETALEQLRPLLDECCMEYGSADTLTLEQAQRSTLAFLDTYVTGRTEDSPALPLDDTVKGTEYQTATLTVLALRYYGIPARYAEGFVVSQSMANQAQPGQPISLDASCAHAWAEVYQDGAGWLPLELTPGYTLLLDTMSQETKLQTGLSGEGTGDADSLPEALPPDTEETDSPQQNEQPTQSPEPAGIPPMQVVLWVVLAILALLLLLLVALLLRHRAKLRRQALRFADSDPAEAIRWIGLSLDTLLPRLSLDRKGGSFYSLCAPAETLEPGYGAALRQMADCLGEAMFSSHPMTDAQARWAREFWQRTVALLPKRQKRLSRLWMKWILCIY